MPTATKAAAPTDQPDLTQPDIVTEGVAAAAFLWDAPIQRYRTVATGRLVLDVTVRNALDSVIAFKAGSARNISQDLLDGRITLADWQTQMMRVIKDSHLVASAVANGGWGQLTKSDFGWTGQRIRAQYKYLANFAAQIADGRQPWNGTIAARAEMYAEAARATHRAALARGARANGMEEERNVLGGAEHCGMCPSESMRGWVPIGSLIPVGSRTCLSRCHCWISFRVTPAEAEAA